jgi:hypothetical protein
VGNSEKLYALAAERQKTTNFLSPLSLLRSLSGILSAAVGKSKKPDVRLPINQARKEELSGLEIDPKTAEKDNCAAQEVKNYSSK